ncbi:MAG TPA: response regulator transcription factor [Tepidisphaeraceae bacterium]|nr:response regulator transcription factor [Tepidisphaeraceae bacterium]
MASKQGAQSRAKVIIIDDHAIVRQGLAELINDQPDLVTCGEADSPPAAMKAISDAVPDVAVVDITLNSGDGIELCRQIHERWPKIAILILSMHDESLYAERALRAGAMGYVMKQEPQETVMAAIRRVLQGETYLSDKIASKLLRSFSGSRTTSDGAPLERLSDRELQIFRMIGQGHSVKAIAESLFLSPKTIETHKDHIKQKLGLKTSNDLLRYAIESRNT